MLYKNCDFCGIKVAANHIQIKTGDEGIELHLCDKCAALEDINGGDKNLESPTSSPSTVIPGVKNNESGTKKVCPLCGLTLREFKKIGRLGCKECYSFYSKEIRHVLAILFDKTQHRGKYPKKLFDYIDIDELKRELGIAVVNEDYEKAAQLRDRIRELTSSCEEC